MQIKHYCCSTIGKKWLVALTGLFMIFFVVAHLLGNLGMFSGPEATNQYAAFLKSIPKILWGFRIVLLAAIALHIWLTIDLTQQSRRARPQNYLHKNNRKASFSSRYMLISGLTVLVFIGYHLAHYTLGITNPEFALLHDSLGRHHVYNMVVMGFSNPLVSGFYILAQILLAFHISHGISSATRTLGLGNHVVYERVQKIGVIFSALIAILFISIPIAVLFGYLPLDT
ncbi:MAG: succinate dehydrogenase cytochrome b subunit [Myxococcales bacterium]|nr:succinate dehydrogenase cytochrome b subunit [Myxococcales bacterium]USN51283.1 MAG: succinate dehydrogenase cytochrome b subunit [Myxococcales bacterium]